MGWHLHDLENGWQLATRGGLNGVYVTDGIKEVRIPEALLLALVADQIVSTQISKLEQMPTKEVLRKAGLITDETK